MAIVEKTISDSILAFLNQTSIEEDVEKARQQFSDQLAATIVAAIKSATVTIPTGEIQVTTNGSPSTQTGVNTAPVQGEFLT